MRHKGGSTLPLSVLADIEDLGRGDAMLTLLREAGREDTRQDVAEAAAEQKPKVRAAGQGCEAGPLGSEAGVATATLQGQGCEQGDAAPLQRQGALFDFSPDAFDPE